MGKEEIRNMDIDAMATLKLAERESLFWPEAQATILALQKIWVVIADEKRYGFGKIALLSPL